MRLSGSDASFKLARPCDCKVDTITSRNHALASPSLASYIHIYADLSSSMTDDEPRQLLPQTEIAPQPVLQARRFSTSPAKEPGHQQGGQIALAWSKSLETNADE